ncbi:hypothetical protein ACFYRG_00775 [Streptomyces mirabilis]|uniref:hypothetical protein n=1 Tax=Streptomyces mirabilis TaxID=68239 RepID=UPI0036CEC8FD
MPTAVGVAGLNGRVYVRRVQGGDVVGFTFLPAAEEIGRLQSAVDMAELLRRDDLPEGDPGWWTLVVSVCNSGLMSAETGAVDAEQWAGLLVRALDEATRNGSLSREETLHRRMIACAAALQYFGVRKGDQVRDPEMVFTWLLGELGNSPDRLLAELRDVASTASWGSEGSGSLHRAIRRLASVRMALEALCDVRSHMAEGPKRSEAAEWCALVPLIPGGRTRDR